MNGAEDIAEHVLVFKDDLIGVTYDERDGFKWSPARSVPYWHDIVFGNRNIDLDRFLSADQARNHDRPCQTVCVLFPMPEPLVEVDYDIFGQTLSFVPQLAANGNCAAGGGLSSPRILASASPLLLFQSIPNES
jgi:hypothetical protein